ncbi:MAG: GldG family protein [Rhodospirillales bacterium]
MSQTKKRSGVVTALTLTLIAIGFVATVMLSNNALRSSRIDLTDDGLFTLSQGTRNVLANLDEPLTLRFYFSSRLSREIPQIGIYGQRVQDMLEEFSAESKGKIRLEVYDPEPFSDVEDRAVGFGLKGVPVDQTGETVYFGLAGTNSTNSQLAIPFFDEQREKFLEYDLARMVYGLAHPDKPRIGVITKLPIAGSQRGRAMALPGGGPDDSWMIWAQAQNLFDVIELPPQAEEMPTNLDLLVLIHPPILSDLSLYAIDQYVLNGGRVLIFVDPHSEADASRPPGMGGNRSGIYGSTQNIQKLMDAWGVDIPADEVAGDLKNGRKVRAPDESRTRMQAVLYPLWMELRKGDFSEDDITTSQLEAFRIASPGHIVSKEGGLTIEPLIQTSEQGGTVDVARIQGQQADILGIANDMKPTGRKIISARLTGKAKTAFPDGPPKPKALNQDDIGAEKKAEAQKIWSSRKAKHVSDAKGDIHVVLTADVDMLADGLWVQVRDMFGQRISVPTSNNGAWFQNLLDNMTGSADLISLRSRGGFQRPFTLIEDIQREAEREFRAKEQELLVSLASTEKQLGEVRKATDPSGDARIVLSDQQKAQIEKFQEEMLRIRKELRNVQFALRSDVEELNGWIKVANIAGMPLAVGVIAIIAALWRSRRRKAFAANFAKS